MTTTQMKEKVLRMEAQIKTLKRALEGKPDFTSDDKVWNEIRPLAKKVRRTLFKELYGKK